jgi:hypothetical protein
MTCVRASCQARLQEAQELQAEAREVGDPELTEEATQAVQRIEVGAWAVDVLLLLGTGLGTASRVAKQQPYFCSGQALGLSITPEGGTWQPGRGWQQSVVAAAG